MDKYDKFHVQETCLICFGGDHWFVTYLQPNANNKNVYIKPYITGLIPVSDVSWQYELSAASILL